MGGCFNVKLRSKMGEIYSTMVIKMMEIYDEREGEETKESVEN